MKLTFFANKSLDRKLFVIIFVATLLPVCFMVGLSFKISANSGSNIFNSPLMYLVLVSMVLGLSFGVTTILSHLITKPLNSFIKSATEIARGELSKKIVVTPQKELGKLAWLFNYMVEDLRRAKDVHKVSERLLEKEKIETILKSTADGIILTNEKARLLLVNPIVEKWFDIKHDKVEDIAFKKVIQHENLNSHLAAFTNTPDSKDKNYEIILQDENSNKQRVLQVKSVKVHDKQTGKLNSVVTVLRDITREKEIDRLKTELVSMVAHELRSPLTCISGFSELLLDDSVTKEQSGEYANIILKESNRLNDLINKFLDISKIESGKSQLNKSPVDMKMLIEKVLDFNSQLAQKKQIKVKFEAPKQILAIEIDRNMIEQAILNLFSNAAKYSPESATIKVRLNVIEDKIILDVEDTGYGISPNSLPRIFDKFFRVSDNDNVVDIEGSGLGLPLVKEIVEIHGGKILVKSELGKGSKFTISLPYSNNLSESTEDFARVEYETETPI